jgi:hypothetical protein
MRSHRLLVAVTSCALTSLLLFATALRADLRTPAWYDENAVGTAPDWHYRVPINVPAGATVNSTVKVDVDFAALLSQLGISGAFDANSPRVVRGTGALATTQEFTDTVYAGGTDAASNSRGEVRFILQDAGPVTYYLYFDIAANGAKGANPQARINGNFEMGVTGTGTPTGWTAPTKSDASLDAQVRPSETVSVASSPTAVDGVATRNTDGTPFTGSYSYLIGNRSTANGGVAGGVAGAPAVTITKTLVVPTTNPGSITFRYRPEGWDTGGYDPMSIDLINAGGTVLVEMVGTTIGSYTTKPFAPNTNDALATTGNSGYRQYNGFDCELDGFHSLGMTTPCHSEPWFTVSQSLASYAGQTIRFRVRFNADANDKTWLHIDDIEWSVVTASLGNAQGFGANITAPIAATTYTASQRLVIRASVDALPTAASNPVTANVYDNAGTLVASGIRLYNNGTHGDATANDGIWSNDGSVIADPTYTFVAGSPSGANWTVRVFAKDASTSTIGASGGLVHIPAQPNAPETQANFFNIDEQTFTVQVPLLVNAKSVAIFSDPVNGTTNPKNIPGALQTYTVRVTNQGAGALDNNSALVVDAVPLNTKLFVGNLGAPGSGPVLFTNGAPSSGLTWTFTALNSATDDLEFSNDNGATWTYTPTADADGCDVAVTTIRMRPKGTMPGNGGGNPYFELRFRVRVR